MLNTLPITFSSLIPLSGLFTTATISHHSANAMAAILGLLIFATITQWLITRKKANLELQQRVTTWWWIIGLLFFVLFIGKTATFTFLGCISFLALKEYFSLVPVRHVDRNAIFWAYISIPFQFYWAAMEWYGMFIIFIPVYLFLFLPMRMVLKGDTKGFINSAGVIHWGVMLNVFCISHLAYLMALPAKNTQAGSAGLLLFLLFITQFNDVSQYVWGKTLGKRKILPKVSPNKTWEGFLGGLITVSVCAFFIAPYLTPLSNLQGLGAGILIGCGGFIGDVVMSSIKRDLQVKDFGHLLPGHGGILDRIDSIIYTAPLFFHYLYYLHY